MKKTIIIVIAIAIVVSVVLLVKPSLRLIARFPALASSDYDGKSRFVDGYLAREAQKRPLRVQKDTLLIQFTDHASMSDISKLLSEYQLFIRSGLADISLFIVERRTKTAAFETARLKSVIAKLRQSPLVVSVAPNVPLNGDVLQSPPTEFLPPPSKPFAGDDCWKWVGGCSGTNGTTPLRTMRFPEAWALNADGIKHHKGMTDVGVLDLGFAPHEDLQIQSICDSKPAEHGTYVAGVIGARFGDERGIDGAAGGLANIIACSQPSIDEDVDPTLGLIAVEQAKIEDKRTSFASNIGGLKKLLDRNLRVINISLGYNWNEITNARPADTPQIREIVVAQGEMVRKLLQAHPDTILVTSAGNDCALERQTTGKCTQDAMWTSPFNWAALGPKTAASNPSENVIVVEALDHSGTAPIPMSNIGGTIAAVGQNILSTSTKPLKYDFASGTSCAAPFVSATIVMMLAENPNLKVPDIKRNLGITDPSHRPVLDAFNAVRASKP